MLRSVRGSGTIAYKGAVLELPTALAEQYVRARVAAYVATETPKENAALPLDQIETR